MKKRLLIIISLSILIVLFFVVTSYVSKEKPKAIKGTQKIVDSFLTFSKTGNYKEAEKYWYPPADHNIASIIKIVERFEHYEHKESSFHDGTHSYAGGNTNIYIRQSDGSITSRDGTVVVPKYSTVFLSAESTENPWHHGRHSYYIEYYVVSRDQMQMDVSFYLDKGMDNKTYIRGIFIKGSKPAVAKLLENLEHGFEVEDHVD